MPRKKFNREEADRMWRSYTKGLVDTITETEKEGLNRGYSSYEIERLFQQRLEESGRKRKSSSSAEDGEGDSAEQKP
jgi:hypothetical protein